MSEAPVDLGRIQHYAAMRRMRRGRGCKLVADHTISGVAAWRAAAPARAMASTVLESQEKAQLECSTSSNSKVGPENNKRSRSWFRTGVK